MRSRWPAPGSGGLVLRHWTDAAPLGCCGLVVGPASMAEPMIAYELLPAARERGYATVAARSVLTATEATGRHRIRATVRAGNAPPFRVLDKRGFSWAHRTADDVGDVVWHVHHG